MSEERSLSPERVQSNKQLACLITLRYPMITSHLLGHVTIQNHLTSSEVSENEESNHHDNPNSGMCHSCCCFCRTAIPIQWEHAVLTRQPDMDNPGITHPRPQCFWPIDALELARKLVAVKQSG
jgi:hypothetical protein